MSKPTLLLLAVGSSLSLAGLAAAADGPAQADLPITAITMYRSGVASFQREGTIDGDKTIPLRFETDQVNDILKSMVLLDSGGAVGTVSFPSKDPLARRLAGYEIDLSRTTSVEEMFRGLRGAAVKVQTPEGEVEGAILTVEPRATIVPASGAGGNPATVMEAYVSLVTAKGVRAFPIARIGSFTFSDPKLNEEMAKALGAVSEQRAERLKNVELNFKGPAGKARPVFVAYVCEAPVWKASYRLVLPDDTKKTGDDKKSKPILQGWAIVENTSDTDWKNVKLSLASGRPVSFTMPLYEPIYASRPVMPVPVMGGVLPRSYEDELRRSAAVASRAPAAPAPASMMTNQVVSEADGRMADKAYSYAVESRMAGKAAAAGNGVAFDALAAATSAATGVDAGEQFLYTVTDPVNIERQRSAMLPILSAPVSARRISIYNPGDNLKSPMRGAELTNDTNMHLMPGPIAIYDAGVYAGDAEIPHTARNAKRMLAYALDLDVSASSKAESQREITRISIKDGQMLQRATQRAIRTYTFDNHDPARGRTIVVEHPKNVNWTLVEPKKADEITETLYRFDVPMQADKPAELKVVEETVVNEQFMVGTYPMETLLAYAGDHKASEAVVKAAQQAAKMQAEITATQSEINQIDAERAEVTQEQDRIRKNMGSVERNSELHSRYVTKLNEQETKLEKSASRKEDLQAQLKKQQAALNDFLSKLNVE